MGIILHTVQVCNHRCPASGADEPMSHPLPSHSVGVVVVVVFVVIVVAVVVVVTLVVSIRSSDSSNNIAHIELETSM